MQAIDNKWEQESQKIERIAKLVTNLDQKIESFNRTLSDKSTKHILFCLINFRVLNYNIWKEQDDFKFTKTQNIK